MIFRHGGAIATVEEDATALSDRRAPYMARITPGDAGSAALGDAHARLAAHTRPALARLQRLM